MSATSSVAAATLHGARPEQCRSSGTLIRLLLCLFIVVLCRCSTPAQAVSLPWWPPWKASATDQPHTTTAANRPGPSSSLDAATRRSRTQEVPNGELYDTSSVSLAEAASQHAAQREAHASALWAEMEAKSRLSSCWKRSLADLQENCQAVAKSDVLRSRLALGLAACDSDGDGRWQPSSFACTESQSVRSCVQGLSEPAYAVFVQYRLHADVLCAYLQEELFQQRTEAAVAALQAEATATVRSLYVLQDASGSLMQSLEDSHTLQAETHTAASALQVQLGVLQGEQATTLSSLHEAADIVLRSTQQADASVQALRAEVQESADAAAKSVEELAQRALLHFEDMQQHTEKLRGVLERFDVVQQVLLDKTFSMHSVVRTVGFGVLVLLLTSPPRTAAARLPALGLITTGMALSAMQSHLPGLPYGVSWYAAGVAAALAIVCVVGYCYVSPLTLQRRLVREELVAAATTQQRELQRWLAECLSATARGGGRGESYPLSPTWTPTCSGGVPSPALMETPTLARSTTWLRPFCTSAHSEAEEEEEEAKAARRASRTLADRADSLIRTGEDVACYRVPSTTPAAHSASSRLPPSLFASPAAKVEGIDHRHTLSDTDEESEVVHVVTPSQATNSSTALPNPDAAAVAGAPSVKGRRTTATATAFTRTATASSSSVLGDPTAGAASTAKPTKTPAITKPPSKRSRGGAGTASASRSRASSTASSAADGAGGGRVARRCASSSGVPSPPRQRARKL